jgi:hypothetical protein
LTQAGGQNAETFALVFLRGIIGIVVSRRVIVTPSRFLFWLPR